MSQVAAEVAPGHTPRGPLTGTSSKPQLRVSFLPKPTITSLVPSRAVHLLAANPEYTVSPAHRAGR
jgi:hypothetical protein